MPQITILLKTACLVFSFKVSYSSSLNQKCATYKKNYDDLPSHLKKMSPLRFSFEYTTNLNNEPYDSTLLSMHTKPKFVDIVTEVNPQNHLRDIQHYNLYQDILQ